MRYPKFALTPDLCSFIDCRNGKIAALVPYRPDLLLRPITDPYIVLHHLEQGEKAYWGSGPSHGMLKCEMRERYFSVVEVAGGKWIAFRDGVVLMHPDGRRVEFDRAYEAQYSAIDHAHVETFLTWRGADNPAPKPYRWGLLTPLPAPAAMTLWGTQKAVLVEIDGKGSLFGCWLNFDHTGPERRDAGTLARRYASIFAKANKLAQRLWETGLKSGAVLRSSKSYSLDDELVRRLRDQMLRGWAGEPPHRLPQRFGVILAFGDLEPQLARLQ